MSDPQAEKAIRDAMKELADEDTPRNSTTVPEASWKRLIDDGASRDDAVRRIYEEIEDMKKRGELSAPFDPPGQDWQLTAKVQSASS
jgi:pyridoxine 5'-phosphate synthase PdxJ